MTVRDGGAAPGPGDEVTDDTVTRGARLAVDVGTVRVGVAASDPDGLVATPVETVQRVASTQVSGTEGASRADAPTLPADVRRIVEIVQERDAVVVYVGLPRHLSGREGSSSEAARTYAGGLAHAIAPVAVRLVDERMSTVSAHQALHASGRSGRRHREVVDQAAAVVILQTALDTERAAGRRCGERVAPAPPAGERGTDDAGRGEDD